MSIHANEQRVRILEGKEISGVTVWSIVFKGTALQAQQFVQAHSNAKIRAEVFMGAHGWVEAEELKKRLQDGTI